MDYPSAFEAFWAAYPRRVRKKDALGAWRGALAGAEVIIKAVRAQVAAKMLDSGKWTPHPSIWLYGERWKSALSIKCEGRNDDGKRSDVRCGLHR